jgi:LacI family transcriptional regulator
VKSLTTIKDIAREAGTNISTVSRALHGSGQISSSTKERILSIAKRMGYTPDISARAMVGKKTRLIGVVVPEVSSDFYAQSVFALEKELKRKDYSITICTDNFNSDSTIEIVDLLLSRKVDGIIYNSGSYNEVIAHIRDYHISTPIILLTEYQVHEKFSSVCVDYTGYLDALKLLEYFGHKHIAYIGEDHSLFRCNYIKNAIKQAEHSFQLKHIFNGPERFELGGYLRMKELLALSDRPTAVLAAYDAMAFGAMRAAAEMGVSIPRDISIMGFDNIRASEFMSPPLTTVASPIDEQAHILVKNLMGEIEEKGKNSHSSSCVHLSTKLIVRDSVNQAP